MDEPLTMERGGQTYYYHRDALGSVTEVSDATGAIVERYEYDVYGEVSIFDGSDNSLTTSAIGNPYLFTGRRFDPESGNYYYRARVYSPTLGRFLSMDPLGFAAGDYNLYRYVFNSPTNLTDPTGEIAVTLIIGGVLITLKVIDYVWTLWDTWQSYRVLEDDCASDIDKLLAGLNIGMAVVFEGLEPDELLPTGLPLDDVARKALLRGMREAVEDGGLEGLEHFLRRELGDDVADQILDQIGLDDLVRFTGQRHHVLSNKIMRALDDHKALRGIFDREDIIVQALDEAGHRGYQGWHRAYDREVVQWLESHPQATRKQFLEFLT